MDSRIFPRKLPFSPTFPDSRLELRGGSPSLWVESKIAVEQRSHSISLMFFFACYAEVFPSPFPPPAHQNPHFPGPSFSFSSITYLTIDRTDFTFSTFLAPYLKRFSDLFRSSVLNPDGPRHPNSGRGFVFFFSLGY